MTTPQSDTDNLPPADQNRKGREAMTNVEKSYDSPLIQSVRFIHQFRYSLAVFLVAVTVVFSYLYIYAKQLRIDRLAKINEELHGKDFAGALVRADSAINSYPKEVVFRICKIQALAGLQRGPDALQELTLSEQLYPNNFDIVGMRAKLLANMGQLAAALAEYKRLADDPVYSKSAEILADKAAVELKMKDMHAALADIDKAVKLEPGEAKFYAIRARIDENLKDYDKAIKDSTMVITTIDFARRAQANSMQSDKAKRLGDMLASLPDEVSMHVLRGQCYEKSGDDPAAYDDYSKAVQSDPSRVDLYMIRGEMSRRHNHYRQAYSDFRHVIEVDPGNTAAKEKMAAVSKFFTPAKVPEEALAPPSPTFKKGDYTGAGYQDMVDGKFQDAIAEFTSALVKDPNDFKARRYLAHCLAKTGDNRNASKQFGILLNMHKLDSYDVQRYAEALEGSGKSGEAAALYEKLVKMRPNDVDLYRSLGRVYSDMDEKKKAIDACARGLKLARSDTDINEFNRIIRDIQLNRPK
jgi:tetratricopeptide (TPR) repeat protein